ncbi:MAG: DUF4296 domain-containing protein [Bacteroidia bacterium]
MRPFSFILLLIGLFFFSCSKKQEKIPGDIIPKAKMVQVMVDIHLAEAHSQFSAAFDNSANVKQTYYKFILNKYKISYNQLMNSWKFYAEHPEIFSQVYDEVITELSKRQAATGGSGS